MIEYPVLDEGATAEELQKLLIAGAPKSGEWFRESLTD
jgi:hypothetical protein